MNETFSTPYNNSDHLTKMLKIRSSHRTVRRENLPLFPLPNALKTAREITRHTGNINFNCSEKLRRSAIY